MSATYEATDFRCNDVLLESTKYRGRDAFRVTMPASSYQNVATDRLTDRPFLAWLPVDFGSGTIEVELASVLAPDAPGFARGFIGLGFRIDANLAFEGLYLRPVNSRVDDQVRRNHTTQYFSYPDYDFARLRNEFPERYESYADIELETWIHVRIVVSGCDARLYVNRAEQPSLVVTDLKHGSDQRGGVGFWIESATVGYFRDLRIAYDPV